MLSPNMEKALNEQIKWEFYSAYLYLSMASYFESISLAGFAQWMKAQAVEESIHAMKFYNFVHERGGRVELQGIDQPPTSWESPLDVIEFGLRHEQEVTKKINNLAELAQQEKDHATYIFLQWFITEQVEEEDSFGSLVERIKLVEQAPGGLFMIDRELAQRTIDFTNLATEANKT